jgi:acetyl/propionyl-CoA carboxylase alpha subunit
LQEPTGPGIRNDCGVYTGATVPLEYDPILSKLIVYAENRELAVKRMRDALSRYVILGIKTPILFLMDVMDSEAFRQGDTHTDFIARHFAKWKPAPANTHGACLAFAVYELTGKKRSDAFPTTKGKFPTPWETLGNWR